MGRPSHAPDGSALLRTRELILAPADGGGKARHSTARLQICALPFDRAYRIVGLCPSVSRRRRQQKEIDMRKKLERLVLLGVAIIATAGSALATPPEGFTSTTTTQGRFSSFDVSNYFISSKGKLWFSTLKIKGPSDGYFLTNVWQPGGTTGW